jgi:hypothetical protein
LKKRWALAPATAWIRKEYEFFSKPPRLPRQLAPAPAHAKKLHYIVTVRIRPLTSFPCSTRTASNLLKGDSMRTHVASVKLEDWAVVPSANPGSYEVLQPGNLLVGRAFGHQRIKPGMFIFTSPIVRMDITNQLVETRNTVYSLGEISKEYKTWLGQQPKQTAA